MNHPIVFIHGSGDSARIWRSQIEHFGAARAMARLTIEQWMQQQ